MLHNECGGSCELVWRCKVEEEEGERAPRQSPIYWLKKRSRGGPDDDDVLLFISTG